MKIAITGGAGFIGTKLAGLLKREGHDVRILDLHKSRAFPDDSRVVDITDKKGLSDALEGIEAVYHLAAEHRDDVRPIEKYYDVNVTGTQNLTEAARTNAIKTIIFTSTVAVYGLNAAEEDGSKETDTPDPFNDYGRSKLRAEKILEKWAAADPENRLVNVRLVATFGAGNRGNIYTLIEQIHSGKFVMIGNGENRKSIAYVWNVAEFLVHCLTLSSGVHLYNYADKPDLPTKALIHEIRHALGKDGLGPRAPYIVGLLGGAAFDVLSFATRRTYPISTVRVRKFCADTVVNADKLQETGFKASYSLQDGFIRMIEREFLEKPGKAA